MLAYARGAPDSWLSYAGRLFPLHASMCAKSSVLEMQLRQADKQGPGGKALLALDSSQLDSLRACVGQITPLSLERFLAALSGAALEQSCSEVCCPHLASRHLPPASLWPHPAPPPASPQRI